MTRAALAALLLSAAPAVAEITPDDLWQALDAVPGLSGQADRGPAGLVVSGLRYTSPRDAGMAGLVLELDRLTLSDTGQGGVEITASDSIGVTWQSDPRTILTGAIAIPGARAFASGTLLPGQFWFDIALPSVRADLTETGPLPDDRTTVSGTLADLRVALSRPSADDGLAAMTLAAGSGDIAIDNRLGPDAYRMGLRLAGLLASARLTPDYLADPPVMPAGRVLLRLDAEGLEGEIRSPADPNLRALVLSLSGLAASAGIELGPEPADGSNPGASITGDLSLSAISYLIEPAAPPQNVPPDAAAPASPALAGTMRGRQSDVTLAGRFVLPQAISDDGTAALNAGLALDLRLGVGAGDSDTPLPVPGLGVVTMANATTGGSATLSLSRAGFLIDAARRGIAVRASFPDRPQPFDMTAAEAAIRLSGPLVRTAAAQPFDLVLRLADVGLSEPLWSLFDPQATIPRDPATLSVRLAGTTEVTGDVLADNQPPGEVPFRLRRLDLTELALTGGGMQIGGSGSVEVPPAPAAPVPGGRIDMTWKGVYGLLDKLTALGLVPQDAGLGIRGGLGMIARPVGPDDLVTRLDFREDGKVLANGVPLPDFN